MGPGHGRPRGRSCGKRGERWGSGRPEDAGSVRRGRGAAFWHGHAGRSEAAAGGVLGGGARIGGRGAASAPGVGERVGRLRRIRFSRCR